MNLTTTPVLTTITTSASSAVVVLAPSLISALNPLLHIHVPYSHIAVIADVQRPKVCLETSQFHFKDAYVDIEKQFNTKLINTGLLPCYYSWSSQVHTCAYTCTIYNVYCVHLYEVSACITMLILTLSS